MAEELRSWSMTEELGMGITNPGSCIAIIGDPLFLEKIYYILCKEHPDWTGEHIPSSCEPLTKISMNSKLFETFRLEHPEIFNNQNQKLKFKYIANEKEKEETENSTQ